MGPFSGQAASPFRPSIVEPPRRPGPYARRPAPPSEGLGALSWARSARGTGQGPEGKEIASPGSGPVTARDRDRGASRDARKRRGGEGRGGAGRGEAGARRGGASER